jgi:hypothetical protein
MPFNLKHNVNFFRNNVCGFFDFAMGFIYGLVLKYELLPELRKYISQEEYDEMIQKLAKNKTSLMDID